MRKLRDDSLTLGFSMEPKNYAPVGMPNFVHGKKIILDHQTAYFVFSRRLHLPLHCPFQVCG